MIMLLCEKNPSFVGLQNYQEILGDIAFWKATLNTIIFTVGSVIGHLIIGTGLALLVNTDINPKARTLFRSLLILPWIFTAVVVAVNWQLLLNPFGIINYGLDKMGLINEPGLAWRSIFSYVVTFDNIYMEGLPFYNGELFKWITINSKGIIRGC